MRHYQGNRHALQKTQNRENNMEGLKMAENHSNLDIKHSIKVIKLSKAKQGILKAVGENQLVTSECTSSRLSARLVPRN